MKHQPDDVSGILFPSARLSPDALLRFMQDWTDEATFDKWNRALSPLPDAKGGRMGGSMGGDKHELFKLAVELRDRLRFRWGTLFASLHKHETCRGQGLAGNPGMISSGTQAGQTPLKFRLPWSQFCTFSIHSQLRNQQLKTEGRGLAEDLAEERKRSADRLSSLEVEVVRMAEAVRGTQFTMLGVTLLSM